MSATDPKKELSNEQKAKIDANRLNALKRKRENEEKERIAAETASVEDTLCCEYIHEESGVKCGNQPIALDLWEIFEESCCDACRHLSDDYKLINKTDVSSQFLIPQDSIKMMKFTTKVNPRNSLFAPMKLYLRKHAKKKSFKRWGSEEGLLKELDRREKDRFERGLAEVEVALDQNHDDDADIIDNNNDIDSIRNIIDKDRKCNTVTDILSSISKNTNDDSMHSEENDSEIVKKKGRKKAKVSSAVSRRSALLGKMVNSIRGDKANP